MLEKVLNSPLDRGLFQYRFKLHVFNFTEKTSPEMRGLCKGELHFLCSAAVFKCFY